MPMSAEAFAGLRTMVAWNPADARMLLDILRERPGWVAYKDDPWGPLHLIQHAVEPMRTTADGRIVAIRRPPLPTARADRYERFGREWRGRGFTKQDLADAIARLLVTATDGEDTG